MRVNFAFMQERAKLAMCSLLNCPMEVRVPPVLQALLAASFMIWLCLEVESLAPFAWSFCLSPLLMFRSRASVEWGRYAFEKWLRKHTIVALDHSEKRLWRQIRKPFLSIYIVTIALLIRVAATLQFIPDGMKAMVENWKKALLVNSPVELVPETGSISLFPKGEAEVEDFISIPFLILFVAALFAINTEKNGMSWLALIMFDIQMLAILGFVLAVWERGAFLLFMISYAFRFFSKAAIFAWLPAIYAHKRVYSETKSVLVRAEDLLKDSLDRKLEIFSWLQVLAFGALCALLPHIDFIFAKKVFAFWSLVQVISAVCYIYFRNRVLPNSIDQLKRGEIDPVDAESTIAGYFFSQKIISTISHLLLIIALYKNGTFHQIISVAF